MLNLLHFNFSINFVRATSRLIDVVCMCVSNKVVKRKTYEESTPFYKQKQIQFGEQKYS